MRAILSFFLLYCFSSYAAAPLTHVYFAETWMKSIADISSMNGQEFMVGNLFPDIQYIANVSRDDTHVKQVELIDVLNSETPFKAGVLFHAYVDEMRESYAQKWKIYDEVAHIADGHEAMQLIKFIEDEILYEKINHTFCIDSLYLIYPEETEMVSYSKVFCWHKLLVKYFQQPPKVSIQYLAGSFWRCIAPGYLATWNQHFDELLQNEKIRSYVYDFVQSLSEEIRREAIRLKFNYLARAAEK